jgi:site-specific DNA-methyltransferase (adenine-specific)
MLEVNQIYHGDCLEKMKLIDDKSIDMIMCDLPYGTTRCKWDVIIPFEPLWKEYLRIIKDDGAICLTAQQPFATDVINSCRKYFRYEIIWEKTQKMGFLDANKRPLRAHENVLVFYKKQPIYNPQKTIVTDRSSVGRTRKQRSGRYEGYSACNTGSYTDTGERYPTSVLKISNWNGALFGNTKNAVKHPTQKPVELYSWCIRTFTNPGAIVLDNCSGSGTNAISCIEEDRNYICIEKDEPIFLNSIERVALKKSKAA